MRAVSVALLLCAGLVAAEEPTSFLINGSLTSSLDVENRRTYPGGGGAFAQGWSNVANLRLRSTVGDDLTFYVSANLSAPSGFYTEALGAEPRLDLERLYFKAAGETLDLEAGLIRVARGYGYVFSPLDFLNARDAANSLDPQARPPGRWGVHVSVFPSDLWRADGFALLGDDLEQDRLWGSRLGAATTFSRGPVLADVLYALLLPEVEPGSVPSPPYLDDDFVHIAGFALKADVEVGLFAEAVYRLDQGSPGRGWRGLEAAAGVDYTFDWRDAYVLCEAMFYGPGPVDWEDDSLDSLYTGPGWQASAPLDRLSLLDDRLRPRAFARHDYLFVLARVTVTPGLKTGASLIAGLDDLSALVTVFAEAEPLQGLTLQLRFLQPLDRRTLDSGAEAGEWGSTVLGFHQLVGLVARVRF